MGDNALGDNTTGEGNTAIGSMTLDANETGSYNTVLGGYALTNNVTGSNNTVIGYEAGTNTGNITGSVLIGFEVGSGSAGSNELYIDNSDDATPLIYGEFDNDLVRVNGTLEINNAYQFPTIDGTDGQVLKSNGSGTLSWVTVNTGVTDIDGLTDGKTDVSSIFIGTGSGISDDGDNSNVALGKNALNGNTSGSFNIAMGVDALTKNTEGEYNSALGKNSLGKNTTGTHNVGLGSYSLYENTTGVQNTAVGMDAGHNSTGSGNIFLGYHSGSNETGSNKLYIDNSNTTEPLIYGEFDNNLLTVNGTLSIKGEYQFPTYFGSDGQVLKSRSGVLIWEQDQVGGGANEIDELSDAKTIGECVYLGLFAGTEDRGGWSNVDPTYNTGVGRHAVHKNETGRYNVALGFSSLNNSVEGDNNTVIGSYAGYNSLGDANIFLGYNAGYNETGSNKLYIANSNTATPLIYGEFNNDLIRINGDLDVTGSISGTMSIDDLLDGISDNSSVYLGQGAGTNDDASTNQNVGVGINSLNAVTSGVANTTLGFQASKNVTTGNGNTAVGFEALHDLTTSWDNTALGMQAGRLAIGHSNIFIGSKAGFNATGNNKLYIENSNSSSPLIYGEFDNDLVRINGDFEVITANNCTKFGIDALSGNTIGSDNVALGKSALSVNVDGNQNTAIGSNAGPNNSSFSNTTSIGYNTTTGASDEVHIGNTSVGWIGGQVGWGQYSDGRFKRNVQENIPGLEFILKLNPVSYNWDIHKLDEFIGATEGTESSAHMREARRQQEAKTYTGFIAQDVEKAAKEIGYNFKIGTVFQ